MKRITRCIATITFLTAGVSAFAAPTLTLQQCNDYPFVRLQGPVTHRQLINEPRNWKRLATTRRLTTNFIPTISTWRSAGFGSNTRQTARSKARSRRRPPDDFMATSAFHTSQRRLAPIKALPELRAALRCGSGRYFPDQADCLGHSASTAANVAITIASARRVVNCGRSLRVLAGLLRVDCGSSWLTPGNGFVDARSA